MSTVVLITLKNSAHRKAEINYLNVAVNNKNQETGWIKQYLKSGNGLPFGGKPYSE
jgi:hypothetical protein